MEINIKDNAEPSKSVLKVLSQHLPYSLSTLRRLQFMKKNGGQTAQSHVLSTFDDESPGKNFLVAFLDFSKGPETEMWLYSSIENPTIASDEAVCEEQLQKLLLQVREIERAYIFQRETPGVVMFAGLHERVVQLFEKHSLVMRKSPRHVKFLFKKHNMPVVKQLSNGSVWSSGGMLDIPLVLLRTAIPYKEASMRLLPSVSIESETGVPIAWAFLGLDGSLKALHCEEEYRGQGFAKAAALKLFQEATANLAQDDLFHADVAFDNLQSQGLCKSLNGTAEWFEYWTWVNLP